LKVSVNFKEKVLSLNFWLNLEMVLKKLTLTLISIIVAAAAVHAAPLDEDAVIFQAMEEEMARSLSELKVDVFGPPYFINYQIRHHKTRAARLLGLTRSTFHYRFSKISPDISPYREVARGQYKR
jgi:hypothetical protein